ncbi:MAG TPA: sugar isomerase, partial [Flavobacteriaceae bacterium]|nr:sugar isomerase [Flavobacteriaceae bacterium]
DILLIPKFGVYGASYATFIAFFTYNTVKLIVVWKKFKMHPFSSRTWVSLGLIALF